MPIGNNSGRIMSGYKKWLTKKQRSRLSGLYRGLRQSTADEMRDQYLDQRGSMNRVRDVASSYGLGEGYRARKQMTFDRAQERYGRQLAMQADKAFEGEVVKAANETIQAENERKQKEYARRLKAAQNRRRAAQDKYNRDMAAYDEQQALLERLRKMKTPKTAQTWKAPVVQNGTTPTHVSPFSWQAHTLTQYTDTGTGNNSPKGGGKSGLIAAALLAGHTGKRLAKGNGTTKPRAGANNSGGKISGKIGRYTDTGTGKYTKPSPTQKIIGRPEAPNFETDPSFALPLEPQMQAQLDVQLKEYQAATPEQQEQIKLGAKDQYAKDVAQYAGAMDRLNTLQRGVQQAQGIMAQFRDLEARVRDTRYSPEQRRGFSQQLSGLQRQYASVMQQQRGASQEISGLQRYIQSAFPRINASRALLGGMGIKYDIDSIAFDADWVRRGNQLVDSNIVDLASNPNRQSDRAKEFWKRADAIGIDTTNVNVLGDNPTGTSYTAVGQRGSTISMTEPEREWFDANGFGNILRAVERDLQYNTQYASLGDAVRGYLQQYGRQSFDYQRSRNAHLKVSAFVNTADKDKAALIRDGESKTNLTKILNDTKKYGDIDSLAYDATGVKNSKNDSQSIAVSEALGVSKDYVSPNTVAVLKRDPASVAFLNFCIANGDMQAVKDYLFEITENANAIMGDIEADRISDERKTPFFKAVHEAFIQFGSGAYSMFENIGRMFSNEVAPTAQWQYTSSDITRNKVERGWNPQFAQTFDSAMQSAGNNAAAFLVGGAIGSVGGALGGVAAKIASHAPGAIMGLSAAGQAKQQALREGYGAKAATMYGIFNGISETVLQENVGGLVGFGDRGVLTKALTNAVNSVKSPVARTLINQGLDILSEIGEEEFGNIVENINRSVTLGEKRGLFDGFAEQAGETAVSTAISTILLNALHIPAQLRSERGYSSIAKASGMSLKDTKFLLETQDDITNGKSVDPKDLSRYNELTAVLTAAMPENVAKAIAEGKMTVADWVTSIPGMQRGMVTQKLAGVKNDVTEYDTTDHTEQYKALEGDNEALTNLLVTAKRTGKVGDAYYVTVDGKPIEISKLSTTEVANFILAQKTAKALKGSVDIVIHDTLPGDNGVMLAEDGSVHVALDAMNSKGKAIIAYKTLVHEVGHALKVSNPGEWNSLKSKLYNAARECKNGKGVTLYDACAKAVAAEYNPDTNPDLYDEELFCTVAQELTGGDETSSWRAFLKDETIFDMIAEDKDLTAKEKKTFLDKFKDSLSKMGKQFSKLGATKEERQFMKWHDSVMPEIEKAYKSINENESLVEKAAKNPGNKANIEAMRKQAEEDAEVSAIIKDLDAKDANIVAAIDGLSGEDLTDEQFRALQRVIDKEEAEITPLGNPYNADGVSPETMVEGTAVESQAQIPVKHSIKARNSIAQRTLETFHDHAENGKKRKGWKANSAITEDMLNAVYGTINEIAEEIEKNYAGKKDKNGMPLLPEETELNNNIFANSSYLKDAEPTSECYRQTIYFALNKMITDRLGRPATQKEAAIINQAAIEIGREAPCIYCYSLLDRKAKEAYKLQYLAERESFISALDERYHGDIEAFKKDRASAFDDLFSRYLAREFDPSAKDKKSSGKRKATEPQRKRLNLWLDLYEAYGKDGDYLTAESVRNPDAEIITRDELYNKYEGNELKLKERELTDIQTWIQDASQAKKVQTYAAYTNAGKGKQKLGGILSWSQSVINKLNREYGLRWYSHADYHPAFVIDNIQQITDASVRGLKGLMYCKPIEAAKIFAPTGMNINVSCFAKYVNGEYVVDDRLGANWAEVQKLREKYPNVGAVMVCTTEDMTMWALTQDWIDVVIPLHTVRSGSEFVEAFGLHDFSAEQADKLTDEQLYNEFVKKVCEEHDIRSSKGIEAVAKESKSIYPREHQNNYETYMAALNERGLTARFERIRKMVENGTAEYNGVKVTPEMYMKLVNETRQSDADTKPLAPNFDWDAVRESIAQLPEKGYFDYFKDKVEIDGQEMDVNQLADRAADDIKAGKNPNELGYGETLANPGVVTRQGAKAEGLHGIHHQKKSVDVKFNNATDTEYLSLAEKYRDGTATEEEKAELEKRVEEAAKEAGYTIKAYHATNNNFTVFDKAKRGKQTDFNASSLELAATAHIGFWFNNNDVSGMTGQKRAIASYLNLNNPLEYDSLQDLAAAIREGYASDWDELDDDFYVDDRTVAASKAADAFVKKMLTEDHDGVVINDEEFGGVSYAVLDSSQVKSADPVTYDDNGDIIPLSERFNAGNEDIRYQSRNVDVDFFPTEKKERKYSTEGVNAQGRNYAARREADARLAERMHEGAIRARIERKANETEAEYKARIKKIYEDRYRREIKNTALKWNKKLVDMLARPTENKHVPVQLARSVAEFCEEVTKYLDGTTKRGEKILDKIRKAYDRAFTDEQTILRAKSEDAGYDARGAVLNTDQKDKQLAEMLKELSDITAEKSFAELTRDEMDALLNVVRGVAFAVTEANKLIGEAEGKTVWQTGSTMIEQLENAPKVSTKLRGYLATSLDLRRLARIFSGSNEDAEFVKLVEQLNQGAIEKERVAQELQAIFKPVTDEYGNEIKKWYGKKAEWLDTGIVTKDGLPVKITKGMRVSLALHVLNEGNMRHIERGGLTIPEAKLYAQGKLADAYANGKLVRLTAEQINDIIANMTEAEKAYVEAAKQLFHDRAGFYVNKTSLQLAGYTKANVENYFPIHTDKNFNKTDFASMSMDGSIEGQGFLQERKNASNPVYLEDITSVVNRQIRGVALYAGMAIPVRNFNAVMNAAAYEDENGNWVPRTTVKQTLAKTMGQYGAKVVEGFVEDASEMSQRVDVTPVERLAGKLSTNYVKAVLLGNLKVAMKQVASYPTAAAVIPWKYLNKALFAGGKNHRIISRADVDLINKYTPLYQMRREGNANEVASLMNKPGMEQKLPWLLGWITKMDVMTVGRLWSAAEYMVEDTHKDLTKGSDEFYREVAKVFNQTIQQTQPNFTPLQRSAALRSRNPIVRSLTLFGTQRMQNGGILIEAAYELKQAKGKSAVEIAAARRKLGRAVASQVTQNLLLLLATIAVDALRGRMKSWQDDDDELTLESIGKKMGDTFLSNILGSFLGGSEFYETISNMYKKANGQTTYDTEFSVPALDAIETIMSFGQSGIPNFINYLNGDHTDEEKLNKLKSFSMELAKVAGYATGLPLENAVKDALKGFYPAYKDIRDWRKTGELIPYLWQSGKLDSAKTRERYEEWIDSGHKGSEFFALDKQLKNAVGGRDGRAEILYETANLSYEDKSKLMEMYDTSDGYAEGSKFYNKNGKELYDFAAEPAQESEAPAEAPSEETAVIPEATTAPAATEAPVATTAPKSDKYTKAAEKWAAYGVSPAQAKSAVEKWEKSGNASEYRSWLSKQGFTGRQKFAMYAQANADVEEKAVNFNKKYGTKYEALWDAYSKYDRNSFHGEEYRAWVEEQTNDYRQRFSLVEFAEPRSNWIEHAEELHKTGVSYEAVWKAARYAKNQSGTGKKDRIIAYAKKLGMSTKQAENIYKWFG